MKEKTAVSMYTPAAVANKGIVPYKGTDRLVQGTAMTPRPGMYRLGQGGQLALKPVSQVWRCSCMTIAPTDLLNFPEFST